MKTDYAIIIKNKTRLEALIERFNTKDQARFYIERSGGDFTDYVTEHENFYLALQLVQQQLSTRIKNKIVERSFLPSFIFSSNQLIIVIGQDGLVANTAKYANDIPIIAVNPDKDRYDGVLLPFSPAHVGVIVEKVLANSFHVHTARFAEARLNDGQRLLAFNDLFIGPASHVSARYTLTYRHQTEEQSSSGIIVSTHSGSTGWLSSVMNMVYGIPNALDKEKTGGQPILQNDQLLFAVREPFKSIRTQTSLCAGYIYSSETLVIRSLMPGNGIIFSDGVEKDFLQFNSGASATIGLAKETARLVAG